MPTTKNSGNSSRENDSKRAGSQSSASQSNANRGKENRNSSTDMNRQGGQTSKTNK